MGRYRQKAMMCPCWGKHSASENPKAENRRLGEASHCRFGVTAWRHLANDFFPHS